MRETLPAVRFGLPAKLLRKPRNQFWLGWNCATVVLPCIRCRDAINQHEGGCDSALQGLHSRAHSPVWRLW